jgi:hypothetical protein
MKNMPVLVVKGYLRKTIPGLGKIVAFNLLSQKRVTVTVRKILRATCGDTGVEVSCTASFQNGIWTGCCKIGGKRYPYTVHRS